MQLSQSFIQTIISVRMDVFTIELIHWASDIGVLEVL